MSLGLRLPLMLFLANALLGLSRQLVRPLDNELERLRVVSLHLLEVRTVEDKAITDN